MLARIALPVAPMSARLARQERPNPKNFGQVWESNSAGQRFLPVTLRYLHCELISSVAHSKLQERSSALEVAALLPQWLHGEIPPHLKWALTRKGHKGAQLTYLKGGISECK